MRNAGAMLLNRSLVFHSFGEPEEALRLEERPMRPLMTDVRVKMMFAPVNPSDLVPIRGSYRHRVGPGRVAGYEGVGLVIEASESHRHLLGSRVLPLRGEGTWQQYLDIREERLVRVPDSVPDHLAARAYINPLTALLMLRQNPPAGRRVLLTAAGSSCARLLAQWAMKMGAVGVAGVCRSRGHAPDLMRMGVEFIDQADPPSRRRLRDRTWCLMLSGL